MQAGSNEGASGPTSHERLHDQWAAKQWRLVEVPPQAPEAGPADATSA